MERLSFVPRYPLSSPDGLLIVYSVTALRLSLPPAISEPENAGIAPAFIFWGKSSTFGKYFPRV